MKTKTYPNLVGYQPEPWRTNQERDLFLGLLRQITDSDGRMLAAPHPAKDAHAGMATHLWHRLAYFLIPNRKWVNRAGSVALLVKSGVSRDECDELIAKLDELAYDILAAVPEVSWFGIRERL